MTTHPRDDRTETRFTTALRENGETKSLMRLKDESERIKKALENDEEVVRLARWQSRIAEAYISGKSKMERMHVWAHAHGIEVTHVNGANLLDIYRRDPEVEVVEQWCDRLQSYYS